MSSQAKPKIIGTIKSIKGVCSAGHKVGDKIELSGRDSGGLCGYFYHNIFHYIVALQLGGSFPKEWGGDSDSAEFECEDWHNSVRIELRRISST